jgi:hypothetical protein
MVLFVLAFLIGEGVPPITRMNLREQLYTLAFAGLFGGLVIAWFWEGWGGALSLAAWGFLAILARRPPWDLPLSIPAAAALIHLLCWWRLRGPAPVQPGAGTAVSAHHKTLFAFLWACLAVFVLLCANEMFGNPPLMTRSGPPPAWMVGTWSAESPTVTGRRLPVAISVELTIAPDGSVAGSIGGADLIGGRLTENRSWFGRLMHWRTEYFIQGSLSRAVEFYGGTAGDRFCVPINVSAQGLDGSLFLFHPGHPEPLGLLLRKR